MFGILHVRFGFRKIRYEKYNKHTDINDNYTFYPWRILENAWYMLLKWLANRNDRRLIVVENSQRNIDFVSGKINAFGEPIAANVQPKSTKDLTKEEYQAFNNLMDKLRARSKGVKNEYKIEHQETIKKDINNG